MYKPGSAATQMILPPNPVTPHRRNPVIVCVTLRR
jgi:hypothetical protein